MDLGSITKAEVRETLRKLNRIESYQSCALAGMAAVTLVLAKEGMDDTAAGREIALRELISDLVWEVIGRLQPECVNNCETARHTQLL